MVDEQFPIQDIEIRIKDILSDPQVRFCWLIDSSGELVVGDFRNNVIPFENDKRRRQMFQELAHRVANRAGFDANMGRVKYSASRREKVVMMSFPLGRYILMVVAEPGVNIDRFGWKIIQKLGSQWSEFYGL